MTDKKRYYKLDDIGIVGVQEKRTPAFYRNQALKTGKILRQFREDHAVKEDTAVIKAMKTGRKSRLLKPVEKAAFLQKLKSGK